ncbi:MAG: hypothetical protein Q7S48_01310 [bacterium]|nr:hypothetical protein [bacterium]
MRNIRAKAIGPPINKGNTKKKAIEKATKKNIESADTTTTKVE